MHLISAYQALDSGYQAFLSLSDLFLPRLCSLPHFFLTDSIKAMSKMKALQHKSPNHKHVIEQLLIPPDMFYKDHELFQ